MHDTKYWGGGEVLSRGVRLAIDFDDTQMASDQYFILTGISKGNFDDLSSHTTAASLRQSDLRSTRESTGCLFFKSRLDFSNQTLATLFYFPNKQALSRIVDSARTVLMESFVPNYLGFGHLSRRDLIDTQIRPLAKRLFAQPGKDKAIVILAETYLYVQKGSNNILQRQTYSLHKGRALIKPMMFDRYIISAIGPYLTNPKSNDAAMIKHIFLTNSECINDWFLSNDLLIVDRDFRNCLQFLEKYEMKKKISAKQKKYFQFVKLVRIVSLRKSDESSKVQMDVLNYGRCWVAYYLIQ